jgi:uncharacterized protein YjiS (DUF1127 family)
MASYETPHRAAPVGAVSIFRALDAIRSGAAALTAWNAARKTRNALYALSSRELDDIGLCRADIEMIGR